MFRQRTRTMLRYVREAGATVLADGRGPVLAVVALGWLLVSGTRFVVPALLPQIKTTFVVFTWQGFTAFFPTYLVAEKGLDQGIATTLYGVFFGTAAVVQPLAGKAGDRYGYRPLLLTFAGTAALSVLALPFVDGLAVLPDDVEGVSYGLLRTVYLGIGATGSVAVGAFADADLFDEAFLFLGGLTAVVFGLYVLPSRPDV